MDEMAVFDAVYRWGEAECVRQGLDGTDMKNLQQVVEKPLKYIRFPLMDSTKFALNVASKNILDMPELTTLLTCFLEPPEMRTNLPEGRFSSSLRSYLELGVKLPFTRYLSLDFRMRSSIAVPLVDTIMIRTTQDDIALCRLSIWKSVLHPQPLLNHTGHRYDSVFATVIITRGQEIVFSLENSPPTVQGESLELKFVNSVAFPSGNEFGSPLINELKYY